MSNTLVFERVVSYDAGLPGVSLSVELRAGSTVFAVDAKVDTGSSLCVFERGVGEGLGFDIESGNPKTIWTATGFFRAFGHYVTLITEKFEFDSEVFFPDDDSVRRNVLGRRGWLDRVVIGIDDYNGKLYLKHHE